MKLKKVQVGDTTYLMGPPPKGWEFHKTPKPNGFFIPLGTIPELRDNGVTNSNLEEIANYYTSKGVTDSRVMCHCGKSFLKSMYESQGREAFLKFLERCEVTTDKKGKKFIKKILSMPDTMPLKNFMNKPQVGKVLSDNEIKELNVASDTIQFFWLRLYNAIRK